MREREERDSPGRPASPQPFGPRPSSGALTQASLLSIPSPSSAARTPIPSPSCSIPNSPLDPARLPLLLPAPPPDQAGLHRPCPSPAGPLQQGLVPTSGAPSSLPPCHGRVAPDLLLAALGAAPPDLPVTLVDDQRCPCSLPSSASSPPHGVVPGLPHHYHLQPRPACSAPLRRPCSVQQARRHCPPLLRLCCAKAPRPSPAPRWPSLCAPPLPCFRPRPTPATSSSRGSATHQQPAAQAASMLLR
nr:vegetative cell wall protein gp1-like [Aegilops tauschii subsp. strangulata]